MQNDYITGTRSRVFDNGAFYSVQLSTVAVQAFKSRWPGSGIPSRSIYFQFDKRNGDLVDIQPDSFSFDGAALVALSDDARAYGKRKVKLNA